MSSFEDEKKQLEDAIVKRMLTVFEQELITEEEMSTISREVLEGIDSTVDSFSLQQFLYKLADDWEVFKPLAILDKAVMQDKVEDEVAEGVLILLENGKIENAIKLAQSATNPHNNK